jgi:hypothetical protein
MSTSWARLILSLAAWLDEITPPHISVSVADDGVVVRDDQGPGAVIHIGELLGASEQAEATIEPWPARRWERVVSLACFAPQRWSLLHRL